MSKYINTRDRNSAAWSIDTGPMYKGMVALLQHSMAARSPGICPYCGARLTHNANAHLIDLGYDGIRCTECIDEY